MEEIWGKAEGPSLVGGEECKVPTPRCACVLIRSLVFSHRTRIDRLCIRMHLSRAPSERQGPASQSALRSSARVYFHTAVSVMYSIQAHLFISPHSSNPLSQFDTSETKSGISCSRLQRLNLCELLTDVCSQRAERERGTL